MYVFTGVSLQLTAILNKYRTGRARTEQRIISSENWWKLRNDTEEQKTTEIGKDGGFKSISGWLHNVIVSKHADAMESYPEPNILPRESGDKDEAKILSAIIPCILEQNQFEQTYSDVNWQKLKTGTGVYKVTWDQSKLNGLGDISIERANLLNLYWEPGLTDIQKSKYFFHTELYDKDELEQMYPELQGKLKGQGFLGAKYQYDDTVSTENKYTVVEVYYHRMAGGKRTLQYIKYVNDIVLYATENNPELAQRGLYDHGRYPYEFDPLFPIEGSPCGYGFVDLCRNPQTEIDLLKTSFVKNAMVGATPRYFYRQDGAVNEDAFLDLSNPLVKVSGTLGEDSIRKIEHSSLDGVYVNVYDRIIDELRQTSGNTESATGSTSSGVTAASAIAALQEASGKGSRDSTQAAYRVYAKIVDLCIELIRQFYELPRQFRIVGQYGAEQFVSYTNKNLAPQHQGSDFGTDRGYRLPVFDIKVSAQKRNVYTKITQNELAVQFFQMGFFHPQMVDQALACIEMMDFDGKDTVMQKISQNGTMFQKLQQYMQLIMMLAAKYEPALVPQIEQDMMATFGGAAPGGVSLPSAGGKLGAAGNGEPANVKNARRQASEASQPA